ncbi:MAG: TRAP transporter large permease subunit, partial [Pseudomonadota bacterium]
MEIFNWLGEHVDLLMFAAAILLLLRGYPVAFTLAGTGLVFALIGGLFNIGFFAGTLSIAIAPTSLLFGTGEDASGLPIFFILALGALVALLLPNVRRGTPMPYVLAAFVVLSLLAFIFDTVRQDSALSFLRPFYNRVFGLMDEVNEVLVAVPLFIFMGVMLERSQVAGELLETMGKLFGSIRGGLGFSVTFVGMLLAASTGIVGATVVTMGLISLPTMLKYGYDKGLACGSICAAGTLGQIIPPSIVLVILGDTISNEYIEARRAVGDWAPDPVSVGDLFVGAIIPGVMLVGLYFAYQVFRAAVSPHTSPPIPQTEEVPLAQVMKVLVPPILLIVGVLGSILAGIATPTEAAAVGAVGAILLAGERQNQSNPYPALAALAGVIGALFLTSFFDMRIEVQLGAREGCAGGLAFLGDCYDPVSSSTGDLFAIFAALGCVGLVIWGVADSLMRAFASRTSEDGPRVLTDVMQATTKVTCMVFVILIGAQLFNLTFRGLGGEETVEELLTGLPGGAFGAMLAVMLVMFVLGFFLDFLEIVFVVIPIVSPVLFKLGLDPVWVAIMMAVNLQTSFLTPPFGFALFYLGGVAPPEGRTSGSDKGDAP